MMADDSSARSILNLSFSWLLGVCFFTYAFLNPLKFIFPVYRIALIARGLIGPELALPGGLDNVILVSRLLDYTVSLLICNEGSLFDLGKSKVWENGIPFENVML